MFIFVADKREGCQTFMILMQSVEMMRFIIVSVLFVLSAFVRLAGQTLEISGFPAGHLQENSYNGKPFYAIKDENNSQPVGQGIFTPDGNPRWEYSFSIDNQPQPVTYSGDSTTLFFGVQKSGVYRLEAVRDGVPPVEMEFVVYYVHVNPFAVTIVNPEDCQEIKIRIDNFEPVRYNGTYPGSRSAAYYLGRAVRGSMDFRETPIQFPGGDYAPHQLEIPDAVGNRDREDRYENADYCVKVVDRFGLEWISDKAPYTSVIPVAGMEEPRLLNTVKVEGIVGMEAGQAPLEVEFRDRSMNAQQYEWYLYRDTADMKDFGMTLLDSLLDNRIRTERDFNYTYMHPGLYKVQLKAINTKGQYQCWDTTEPKFINVVISLVNVPNVFTPNGDGKNDVFCVQAFSVEAFEAIILNRWGRKVYEWHDPEGGWDGRINGKYATPGTYYYIVTARGREKSNPPKYVKKGALLLVR